MAPIVYVAPNNLNGTESREGHVWIRSLKQAILEPHGERLAHIRPFLRELNASSPTANCVCSL